MDWLMAHEPMVRLAAFGGVLAALLAAEALWPRRRSPMRRALRWRANFPIVALDTLLVRLLFPLGAVGAALWAEGAQLGLLNRLAAPAWLEVLLAFLALDALIYWQHRWFHHWGPLWRLHRMHHSDVALDATTGVRFHPLEILLSMGLKVIAVTALGAPALAVLLFEVALNATAMFSHANLRLPLRLDAALRRVIVTPDMHRVHHSVHRDEHDRNFGFNLSWWDVLFGSYAAQPRDGHDGMAIGLPLFREDAEQHLGPLLLQPGRPLGR